MIRQLAAYILGLIPSETSRTRLQVLLENPDGPTQLNAAIGFARQGSTLGYEVIKGELQNANQAIESRSNEEVLLFTRLANGMLALESIAGTLTESQRMELREIVKPLSDDFREVKLRIAAKQLLLALNAADGQEKK